MTNRAPEHEKGLPEWADRLREWLEDLLPSAPPEPAVVPVPVRSPSPQAPTRRRRRR